MRSGKSPLRVIVQSLPVELIRDETKAFCVYRICSIDTASRRLQRSMKRRRERWCSSGTSGSIEDPRVAAESAKKEMGLPRFWIGWGTFTICTNLDGTFTMKELNNDLYPVVKTTS